MNLPYVGQEDNTKSQEPSANRGRLSLMSLQKV